MPKSMRFVERTLIPRYRLMASNPRRRRQHLGLHHHSGYHQRISDHHGQRPRLHHLPAANDTSWSTPTPSSASSSHPQHPSAILSYACIKWRRPVERVAAYRRNTTLCALPTCRLPERRELFREVSSTLGSSVSKDSSSAATLVVHVPAHVTSQPASKTVNPGTT